MSNYEHMLPEIINSLKSTSGEDFFNTLTLQLDKHIGADYTLIARLNQESNSSKTICLVAHGKLVANIEYSLLNTPCAEVNNNSICIYPNGITNLYPDDQLLIDMNIEGYIGTPLHDSLGNVLGHLAILNEKVIENPNVVVTLFELFSGRISAEIERVEREDELKAIANTLEINVLNRTEDLTQTLQSLKEAQEKLINSDKMAALGKMTASIAHEINNPTNFTYASVYMMLDEIKGIKAFLKQLAGGDKADAVVLESFDNKFDKLIELVQTANEGTTRIKSIVDSLRTFSHLGHLNKEKTQISTLITSTLHLIRTEYRNIAITSNFEYDPLLNCLPSKLNQVFMNLIINACQAINFKKEQRKETDDGYQGQLTINTNRKGKELVIEIADNGCGMDDNTQEKIFDAFFTTKDVNNGTGLGMSVSFDVIESHNGSIAVKSELGVGSIITIHLPLE
jgi:signal transduction histidine kinase